MTGPDLQAARRALLTSVTDKPLTQRLLGRLMDIDSNSVSAIEGGRRPPPMRYISLLNAYTAGYRPKGWPE